MRSDFTTDLELQHGPAQVLLQHEPVGGHPGARGHGLLLRLTRVYSDEDLDLETQPETNQLMNGVHWQPGSIVRGKVINIPHYFPAAVSCELLTRFVSARPAQPSPAQPSPAQRDLDNVSSSGDAENKRRRGHGRSVLSIHQKIIKYSGVLLFRYIHCCSAA